MGKKNSNDVQFKIESGKYQIIIGTIDVLKSVFRYTFIVAMVWIICNCLSQFAGRDSSTTLKVFANLSISKYFLDCLMIVFGVGGMGWGYKERQIRKRYIERYTRRHTNLEKKIDSGRTSCGLTSTGDQRRGE